MAKPKTKIFIDGANVFYTQKHLGWSIDWKKAVKIVSSDVDLIESRYYTGIKNSDRRMKKYLQYLRNIGIKTITKPLKAIMGSDQKMHYKSNCDVEMAIDVILDVNSFDSLVLFSGDSDFVYLIKILQHRFQKKVVVYSSRKTIAWELKLAADSYTFIEDLRSKIKRQKTRRLPGGTVKQTKFNKKT